MHRVFPSDPSSILPSSCSARRIAIARDRRNVVAVHVSTFATALVLVLSLVVLPASNSRAEPGMSGSGMAKPELPRTPRPKDARVYFITPHDGETVASPVIVRFGLEGMGVAPAGVEKEATGHHHLIIDAPLPPSNLPVPKSENYRHFGNGQTEVSLELTPGTHTLQLLLGDHLHIPHDPPIVSERISITVKGKE